MMNTTQTSLFIIGNSSKGLDMALPVKASPRERSRLIYHAIGSVAESFEQAAGRLIRLADLAYGQRDYDALEAITASLRAIPFKPAQDAGRYFQALCLRRARQYDAAAALLETVSAPRAVQSLATICEARGDYGEASRLYSQAARSSDGFAVVGSLIQLSAIKSVAGEHASALHDLQNAWPMVRLIAKAHPHLWFQYHNEIAVELAAVGQVEAARKAIAIAVASPISERYAEWQETADELRQPEASRLVLVVPGQGSEDIEPAGFLPIVSRNPRRASAYYRQTAPAIYARILHARAGPRGPPSLFVRRMQ